jgi:hypothetical protein
VLLYSECFKILKKIVVDVLFSIKIAKNVMCVCVFIRRCVFSSLEFKRAHNFLGNHKLTFTINIIYNSKFTIV